MNNIEDGVEEAVTATRGRLSDANLASTFVPLATVDLATFLNPGETLPNDGIADAQPLFQRALAAVVAGLAFTGSRNIQIPPGKWAIDASVRWFTGYHVGFVGSGRENTIITPRGNAVFGLMDPSFDSTTQLVGFQFAHMTIDCTAQVSAPNNVGAKGIALRYLRNVVFESVTCIKTWATSFGCDFLQDVTFSNCRTYDSGQGVTGGNDSFGAGFGIGVGNYAVESVRFINCYAENSHSAGFFFERLLEIPGTPSDARGVTMTSCISSGGYNGLRDAGADGLIVDGCHFLNASNAGIHIEGYSANGRHGGRNGIIQKSVIRGNGVGVLIGNAATGGYTFDNCEINANVGAGVQSTTGGQIGVGWRWTGCRIENNGAGGIILGSSLVGRPEIVRCTIRQNGVGDGIYVGGDCYQPRFADNIIQGHQGAAIKFDDTTRFLTDPFVQDNILTENVDGAIINSKVTNDSTLIANNRTQAAFATITNEFTTPGYQVDVSQVAALSRFDAPVQMTDGGKFGTSYARLTVNQAGSPSARIGRVSGSLSGTRTESTYIRLPKGTVFRPFAVGYWNSNANQRTWQSGGRRATGDWQRVALTVTLPANGSRLDIGVAIDGATVGINLDVDGTNCTPGTVLWPYIDGNQAGCAWTGTAEASTSVWTVGDVPTPTLAEQLSTATGGESPAAQAIGSGTITSGLSISTAQPLTLYSVVPGTPTASMRSALRTSTSADRLATGRNSGNTAWVGISNNSASTSSNAQVATSAVAAVVAAMRDASGVTAHVRNIAPVSTAIASYEAVTATRLVNDAGVTHTLVYVGAHDEAKRNAVMDVLANYYGVA